MAWHRYGSDFESNVGTSCPPLVWPRLEPESTVLKSSYYACTDYISYSLNHFEKLHSAWQWHCRALWEILKRLDNKTHAMDKWDFARFEVNMSIGRIFHTTQRPGSLPLMWPAWDAVQYQISIGESSQNQISRNLVRPSNPFQLSNRFELLHGSIAAVLCAKFRNDWITYK